MKPEIAIVQPAAVDLDLIAEQIIVAASDERQANASGERHEGLAAAARATAQARRLEIGRLLSKARTAWPERGKPPPGVKGTWGEFLARVGMTQPTAWNYIELHKEHHARANDGRAAPQTRREAGLDNRPLADDRDAKPSNAPQLSLVPDSPAPQLTEEQLFEQLARLDPDAQRRARKVLRAATAADGDRDSYCTPEPITRCFPVVDFDPCSNSRSTVRSRRACWWTERGEDGLAVDWIWSGSGYWNVPYSKPLPWAAKFDREHAAITAAGWLVNTDQSTEWWSLLVRHLPLRLDFDERIQFAAPPGVVASQNDRPQTLLMDDAFWRGCDQPALLKLGTLWRRHDQRSSL